MNHLEELKAAIVKAVPEIMELKFGCYINYPGYENARIVGMGMGNYRVWCERRDEVAFLYVSPEQIEYSHVHRILGREITLADALKALWHSNLNYSVNTIGYFIDMENKDSDVEACWNLSQPLSGQSQETIDFLYSIICK